MQYSGKDWKMPKKKSLVASVAFGAVMVVAVGSGARAAIVNINGAVSGYYPVADPVAGFTNPLQLTLDAGTYTISDAFGSGGLYNAYNQHLTYPDDWYWDYVVGDAATGAVLLQVGPNVAFQTEAQAEAAGLDLPPATLTLSATATLDFAVYDKFVPDNTGGISLTLVPATTIAAPEPSGLGLMLVALVGLGFVAMCRHSDTAS
jgi:hypothetical protein